MEDTTPSGGSNGVPTVSSVHYATPEEEEPKKRRRKKRDAEESSATASTDPSDYRGYEPQGFLRLEF